MTVTLNKHVPLCFDHFWRKYNVEPDLDSQADYTWRKGKCARCGQHGIVFQVDTD